MAEDNNGFSHISIVDDDDEVVIHAGASRPSPAPEEPEPEPEPDEVAGEPVEQDGYRETTLEDLETGPMSLMQKVIIAVAVVAVVAFVVYYALFY